MLGPILRGRPLGEADQIGFPRMVGDRRGLGRLLPTQEETMSFISVTVGGAIIASLSAALGVAAAG
jgi:hypothetical protein